MAIKNDLKIITDQLSVMNEKLDQNTESLVNIETEIKIYKDMYRRNNDNSKKLEKRIEPLEQQARIIPPPELTLAEVE